jgi:hypothetical protein
MLKRTSRLEKLAKKEERATIKRIIYLSGLSLILAIFLFTLGVPLLGKFADFANTIFQKNETSTSSDKSVTQPPIVDLLPAATNSAHLAVSGFADEAKTVEAFVDSQKVGETQVKTGKFAFDDLVLKKGENKISVKAISQDGKESDFSKIQTVILDQEEPKLEVETPGEGQSFSGDNRIKVLGKTDQNAQVFANGFLALVDSEGKFEVFVPVVEGENTIEIKAQDAAGNTKVETRKVNFRK